MFLFLDAAGTGAGTGAGAGAGAGAGTRVRLLTPVSASPKGVPHISPGQGPGNKAPK